MIRTPSPRTRGAPSKGLVSQALCLLATLALAACGSGGGSADSSGTSASSSTPTAANSGASPQSCSAGCGAAMLTLTDAPGDFISYIVNVVSLQLTRADGAVVQTVPVATQVDFAQLVNLSEIVSAAQIPAGRYVSASITLDYSGATIVVDNGTTGVTIAPANIINGATSVPLVAPNPTQVTLTLSLDADNQLVITPTTVANLALDFNLAASNAITPSAADPTTVTVDPVLTASLVPDTSKQIRVRGPLISVNSTASSYVIGVRPFYNSSGTSGQFTVTTSPTTTYSINGTAYTGAAGLTQLASLATGTVTAAYGTWDTTSQTFTASNVLAGSSVAGTSLDSVEGTVVARTGDTLTLADDLLYHAGQFGIRFDRQVTVTVGSGTTVTEAAASGAFSIEDISVGQHMQVFGTLGTDSQGNPTLDATAGSAQLALTSLLGTVISSTGNLVTLNLQSLDGRPASSFDFAGTGSTQDATAAAYTVMLPTALSATSLTSGLPVRFWGFVTPFGSAPPDFTAASLVNYAQTRALLQVRWPAPGITNPFATLTGSELLISQTTLQASAQDVIRIASVALNPSTLTAGLQVDPDSAATNAQFAIGHLKSHKIDSFDTFSDFVTALTSELNGTNEALGLLADGPYDAATGVFSADQMIVVTND
jgi:Domain of unknown function (DUF4382)